MWLITLFVTAVCVLQVHVSALCPHEAVGLKRWSDNNTWTNGVPLEGEPLEITEPILLDTTTVDLGTVTIETGGRLVFDAAAALVRLSAENVVVRGELWIGAEECPFTGQAELELVGLKGEIVAAEVQGTEHEKAVIVDIGGKLEIHGIPRHAWSRLTTTLPKTDRDAIVGNPLYNHDGTQHDDDRNRGIVGYEFGVDGQMIRFLGRLARTCDIAALITQQDNVMVFAIQRELIMDRNEVFEEAVMALEQLCFGGQNISNARSLINSEQNLAWVSVCHVGHPENSIDEVGTIEGDWSKTSRLIQTIGEFDFVAYSAVKTEGSWPYDIDILSYNIDSVPSEESVLTVEDDNIGWQAGERVVIASTDYDFRQAEVFELQPCSECSTNEFKLARPFEYTHWGETTEGINMGAEVALLCRNVRIFGRLEDACYGDNNCDVLDTDTYGGHIKMMSGFASARIENAELYHMGQSSVLGSYPIHFHMCGDISNMTTLPYVKKNSIHNTFARCVTIHGTSGMLVEGNAAYDNMGHCYFLEDGSELNTVFDGNLGLSTRRTRLTPTDNHTPSTFWITHPSTVMRGNVAGGSEGWGIWYVFPRSPIGPSAELGLLEENQALKTPLDEFFNNVAHSNNEYGLRFDNILASNGHAHGGFNYNPLQDPLDSTSPRVTVVFDGFTAFKNYKSVMIRGPSVVANNFKIAESVEGFQFLDSAPGRIKITNSLFVGETENKGKPEGWITLSNGTRIWWDRSIRMNGADNALPIIGILFFESHTDVVNVTFSHFKINEVRPSAAMGIKRRFSWYNSPVNSVKGANFLYSDPDGGNRFYDSDQGRGFEDQAGNINSVIRDIDGSLTTYPGSTIVKPYDFLLNARCAEVPSWNMYVCPTYFTKLRIVWSDASIDTFITRNDGAFGHTVSARHSQFYALNSQEGYILNFNATVPRRLLLRVAGVEAGVNQVLGICIGRNVTPKTVTVYGSSIPSAEALFTSSSDVTRYYHDKERGLLLFRFASSFERTMDTQFECPGDDGVAEPCPTVFVELFESNTDGDCSERAYPEYQTDPLSSDGALTTPDFS